MQSDLPYIKTIDFQLSPSSLSWRAKTSRDFNSSLDLPTSSLAGPHPTCSKSIKTTAWEAKHDHADINVNPIDVINIFRMWKKVTAARIAGSRFDLS